MQFLKGSERLKYLSEYDFDLILQTQALSDNVGISLQVNSTSHSSARSGTELDGDYVVTGNFFVKWGQSLYYIQCLATLKPGTDTC